MESESGQDPRNLFCGLARIYLTQITHEGITIPEYFEKRSPSESKRASAIAKCFDIEGCQRANHHNFVDVLASSTKPIHSLPQRILSASDAPTLDASIKVQCLHGLHRLLAACETIKPEDDRWWIARVYTERKNCRKHSVIDR
jgi:hypothetical protein